MIYVQGAKNIPRSLTVFLRPAARIDQLDLAEYYDEHGGESFGELFLQRCNEGFDRLSQFPESGTIVHCNHLKLKGCRFILVPEFEMILIFYKAEKHQVQIVRILHGSRDIIAALD